MAHRYNVKNGRVEPKPTARERTWYRWRMRKGLEEKQDIERRSRLEEVKEKIRESIIEKLRRKKQHDS